MKTIATGAEAQTLLNEGYICEPEAELKPQHRGPQACNAPKCPAMPPYGCLHETKQWVSVTGSLASLHVSPCTIDADVDVRKEEEYSKGHVGGSVNIPLGPTLPGEQAGAP